MYNATPGRMQAVYGSWIRWLVSRIRSYADKLRDGWERREVQRTAKRYVDDCYRKKMLGLRLLLLAAVVVAARALPPQTNRQTSNDEEKRHGAKCSQICVV